MRPLPTTKDMTAAQPTKTVSPPAVRTRPGDTRRVPTWLNGLFALTALYFFLCAIKVMGSGLKTLAKDPGMEEKIREFFRWADNPVAALLASVVVTSVVQSSSFTTSLIVVLAADGIIDLETAVYAVMGANIGTSVTGVLVSLGNVRIRRQFRRSFQAALVHDIFNWLTVLLLFPLEWITSAMSADGRGVLGRFAFWMSESIGIGKMEKMTNPVSVVTGPVVDGLKHVARFIHDSNTFVGTALAVAGLVMLFAALVCLVVNLKGALLRRMEGLFRRVFFRNDGTSYVVGVVTTVLVQSSSVSTSIFIPLCGAGAVKWMRVLPFMLGANLGTTVTGLIAATAKIGTPTGTIAVAVALSHVTFNLVGSAVWYPLRRVPTGIARWYGRLAARSKRYAFLFLVLVFFVIPLIGLAVTEILLRMTAAS